MILIFFEGVPPFQAVAALGGSPFSFVLVCCDTGLLVGRVGFRIFFQGVPPFSAVVVLGDHFFLVVTLGPWG